MSKSHFSLLRSSLIGGGITAVVIFVGTYMLGSISDAEAIDNLQEIRPTLRFTASGAMGSTATILALMLTLLSFSQQSDRLLKNYHYDRIWWIARFSAGVFAAALVLLMALNIPISNAEETLGGFYNVVYYVLLIYTAVIGGCMISIILLLYQATRDIILIAHPDRMVQGLYRQNDETPDLTKRERERMTEPDEEETTR